MPLPTVAVDKDMSITHEEFFRVIPRALGLEEVPRGNSEIIVADQSQRLEITLFEESTLRIGALALPTTKVRLLFTNYTDADISAIVQRFDRAFQRGGG